MKLFIDTANVDEIKEVESWGILSGVTTNPTLIAKENKEFHPTVKEICEIVKGPVSAEVISLEAEGMIKEAKVLADINEHVVVKVPMTLEGLKAVKELNYNNIKTNVTLVFSANQALMAAKAGATYVSPFIGRVDDLGNSGINLLSEIVEIYYNYSIETEIIAASIRHPEHVVEAARTGADIATIPYDVLCKMAKHPMTDLGIARFLKDWENVKG